MFRKGFTLIELLIVITIIAILAGAAVPYVQDYVEDARYAKAKSDLDEIRNALVRYETDRGTTYAPGQSAGNIGELVGPYLSAALVDPWGGAYVVNSNGSTASSNGPDGVTGGGDDVSVDFRPPLALSKAYWEDTNQDGRVSGGAAGSGDCLILKFTRPASTTYNTAALADFEFVSNDGVATAAGVAPTSLTTPFTWDNSRQARIEITGVPTPTFVPGSNFIRLTGAGAGHFADPYANSCKYNSVPIKAR